MNESSFFYCFIAIALICNSKRHGRLQILLLAHRNKRWLWQRRAPFRNSSNCWVHRWQTWRNNRFGHLAILLVMALQHVTKFLITMPPKFCWSCWEPSNRYVSEFKGFFSTNVRGGEVYLCVYYHSIASNNMPYAMVYFQLSFLRNIVWLMSNLCRNKNPAPPADKVKLMLPALAQFLCHFDVQILSEKSTHLTLTNKRSVILTEDNKSRFF